MLKNLRYTILMLGILSRMLISPAHAQLPHAVELESLITTTHGTAFLNTLTQLQKIHYQTADWPRFFAYAQYYRLSYLKNSDTSEKHAFQVRLFSLEVLALARHCYWSEAQAILFSALALAQTPEQHQELKRTEEYLVGLQKFTNSTHKAFLLTPVPIEQHLLPFPAERSWKMSPHLLGSKVDPRTLRVILPSRCENG